METRLLRKTILFIGDAAILVAALYLTLLIRYGHNLTAGLWRDHIGPFGTVLIVMLVVFYINDLYELTLSRGRFQLFNRLFQSFLISGGIAIVFFYIGSDRLFTIKPQRVFLIYIVISAILIYGWRFIFNQLARSPKIGNGLLLIGFNNLANEIVQEISEKPELGFKLKTIVLDGQPSQPIPSQLLPLTIKEGIEKLKVLCQQHNINTIVSTINPRENPILLKNLFACLPLKVNFYDVTNFYELITGKIPVTTIEQIWFLENLTESRKHIYDVIKRMIDIILAIIGLVLAVPFFPLIILIIRLGGRGPILFTQVRSGKDGKSFTTIKFRTMVQDAEKNGPQWAAKNDPRVTPVGAWLRRTRIDEIPQLLNVLRGEMSLIGPRPERPEFVEKLQSAIPFYKERLLIKPGLTGWAQVVGPAYGGSEHETLEKLQYDLFYIKNRSLGLDISIILKTIRTVLTRKGQ